MKEYKDWICRYFSEHEDDEEDGVIIQELIRCGDCHHFAISATLERADGTIRPVGYICRLHKVPVEEDGFCSMAIKRPERWKHYE